jgi:hypothetical protein
MRCAMGRDRMLKERHRARVGVPREVSAIGRERLNGQKASALKLVRMLLCSPREEKKTAYIYCRDLTEPLTKLLQAALLGRFLQLFAEVALAD